MSLDIIKFAFAGGEVSPAFYGRSDLEKFDLALAESENWFVDYLGGLSNTPGTEFLDFIQQDTFDVKLFTFKFSSSVANTNVILFGKDRIRFLQDGAYVLEASKVVTAITQANPAVVTIVGHGYATGDMIQFPTVGDMTQLFNRTCVITKLTNDTFSLQDVFGNNINSSAFTTYTAGATVARVYTLVSPYATTDLVDLRAHQIRDVIRLTHPDYTVRNLRRISQASWTLTEESFDNDIEIPVITTVEVRNTGDYSTAYVVTSVTAEEIESLPSDYEFVTNCEDLENNAGAAISLRWTPVDEAKYYNVYRTRISFNDSGFSIISRSFQVGYVGQARGAFFVDTGITPDFAKTPPQGNNPFADSEIISIDVDNGGTGYANTDTITITDADGTGFIGYPIIGPAIASGTGPIVGIAIVNGGSGYTSPSISVTTATGSGAAFTINLGTTSGNNPHLSTVYQQRQLYGSTDNKPLTVFGSKPGQLSNFGISDITVANDSFEHEIDSDDNSPLRHIISTRGGLLAMTPAGVWLMAGSQGDAITATDVQAEPQTYTGVSDVEPLKIDTDIIYVNGTGGKVNALAYADQYKLYSPTDISVLASHLLEHYRISRWCYADEPHRLIHAVREDGTMLLLTMMKEEEIYAWARRVTKGEFLDCVSLDEGEVSSVYVVTRRYINGRLTKMLERVAQRNFNHVEEAVFLDASLKLGQTTGAVDIQIAAATGTGIVVTASSAAFSAGDVGKILRYGKGKAEVVGYASNISITIDIIRDFDRIIPFSTRPRLARAGEWTLDSPVTTVSGLHHLEGEIVTALADGNVVEDLVVTAGAITLPTAATMVVVGIPYTSKARNLPLNVSGAVVENKRKRVTKVAVRVKDTRGLLIGSHLDHLYTPRADESDTVGEPDEVLSGMQHVLIEPVFSEDAQNYFVQEEPLPVTIVGYVLEAEVGDDPN